ncbi:MAG TPA: DNA-formamidopyrimidine glycosylase family protein, partial [Dehalococcoidia bacterium]|nr:DNA-formamidopyrimidine glycosylase family protein [Dehalococcoidia bacterium]
LSPASRPDDMTDQRHRCGAPDAMGYAVPARRVAGTGDAMPETPDLEAIRGFFNARILGRTIVEARILIPVVARFPREEFAALAGDQFAHIDRRGKFLLFRTASGRILVINAMLTGRFQYVDSGEKRRAKTCAVITLDDGCDVRYADERLMGKLYLATEATLAELPQFGEMGPDVLDPALTEDVFLARLRRHRGELKGILVNHRFVAGIGNAYADEVLWEAGLHPYRKRTALSDEGARRLYEAMRAVMDWAIPILAEKAKDQLPYEEWRDHMRVHRKGGKPCPRCGTTISEVTAGQRITNFCRTCQS